MSSLNQALLKSGILRETEDPDHFRPVSASEISSATNAEQLKMMTAMYGIVSNMKKPDSVSQEEHDHQMRRARMAISKLTTQMLNDLTASRKAKPKNKSKRSSSKKKPYDKPSGC